MNAFIASASDTVASYRQMIDATLVQLSDEEFFRRPHPNINSVATIVRHLAGNLKSRWTDFLTTDGEKPDRDRDAEFEDWSGTRAELMAFFDEGWKALTDAIGRLDEITLARRILIRGQSHTVPEALLRSLTHTTYHIGQICQVARTVHQGEWRWLTIPPNQSNEFNRKTWGKPSSRGILEPPSTRQ